MAPAHKREVNTEQLPVSKGALCVFSNGVWREVKDTPLEGVYRNKEFRDLIPAMKKGEVARYKGHSFKIAA